MQERQRMEQYIDIAQEFITNNVVHALKQQPIILLRVRNIWTCWKDHQWYHVYQNQTEYDYDVQNNINSEDLIGICGIFSEISDDIISCRKHQNDQQALVIVNIHAMYTNSEYLEHSERENRCIVFLYEIPKDKSLSDHR